MLNNSVLEGSSGEDEVEDKTFDFLRGRGRDEARNFSLFLGLCEDKTRNSSEFWPEIFETFDPFFRGQGQDEERNFASFLGHFVAEPRPSRTCNL